MNPPASPSRNAIRKKPRPQSQSPTPPSANEFRKIKAQWSSAKALAAAEDEEEAQNAAAAAARRITQGAPMGEEGTGAAGHAASEERLMNSAKERDARRNKLKESVFKIEHAGVLGVLGWFLFIHLVGIFFFTKGFLLTRMVLENKSECSVLPFEGTATANSSQMATSAQGCWHPKTFDKAVVIIIDALRYDFTVPFRPTVEGQQPQFFHNNLPVLHETAVESPEQAFLLPFIADPPTTTLQRLKGLTTGTLPTFIDAGSNFAGTAIDEDNMIAQLHSVGKRVVHLGDDTWQSLFPDLFEANLSRPYDSFNVRDLHTVDNGVIEHLFPLLHAENATKWDVIVGHFLGVDHAGHRYGPNHAAMAAKLQQMDRVIRDVMRSIDESTLLVVMGDHGMDGKGDHGGESDDEVEAALWMYSKRTGVFGRTNDMILEPPRTAKERPIPQIDLVPTLALLLGIPIPFNNLGSPIEEAFSAAGGRDLTDLVRVNRLASAQIKRYQHAYALARGADETHPPGPLGIWSRAEEDWNSMSQHPHPRHGSDRDRLILEVYKSYREYQRDTLHLCKSLWTRFDIPSMIQGILISFAGVILLLCYARGIRGDRTDLSFPTLRRIGVGSGIGVMGGMILTGMRIVQLSRVEGLVFGIAVGGICAALSTVLWVPKRIVSPMANSLWAWLAIIFTVLQSIGFSSNSFTIWEDEILLFFLTTFGVVAALSSLRQKNTEARVLGFYHSIVFVVLGRIASFSRLCREEQMPFCVSTYYASSTSSTSAWWHLLIPFLLALVLPSVIRSYYQGSKSYEGSAVFWIGIAFRTGLFIVAAFWTLDAADDGDWFPALPKSLVKTTRVTLAQVVLAIAFAAGTTTFVWAKPCVSISMTPNTDTNVNSPVAPALNPSPSKTIVTILGYANVHGTRYSLLLINFALAIILLQKPMGGGAIGLQTWQIFSLLEILDTNGLTTSNCAIGPVVLGLLGSFHFFTTGHQATLSSIQWEIAFVPLTTVKYPWSPLIITLNTFGAQVLSAVAVPLTVLWKRPIDARSGPLSQSSSTQARLQPASPTAPRSSPKNGMSRLLSDVAQAATTHILYYATINLATTMWVGLLRRHLMLYRIFNPRFMMGALVLVVVDVVVLFVSVVGVRWNTVSVADVFGWS
ncbi:phosphoethanolamine transferase class O [Histoplasma capsulatum var. duboisii H88]|uniref:Phosphoethanolamine transferase class O n=1 Tax=Ajellomyces capsulatus (strain H88) TaxID=544711 RepID=F0UV45_AJEC8|nr:phosphoethanolamine transferase class O [Histoplasma capsulatum var. duboisii H88]QSS51012.1 phosphoethanolamine transferase class O [Histoplasma capsulatum var. duboisii H88]